MKQEELLLTLVALGLVIGLTASYILESSSGECSRIEDNIRQGQNFTGTIACYPPGVVDVNISEEIQNQTDLKCVCRKVNDGNVQLFPITSTS